MRSYYRTREKCYGCGAKGDAFDNPIHAGHCDGCDRECCDRCGRVEGDMDGTFRTCPTCIEEEGE